MMTTDILPAAGNGKSVLWSVLHLIRPNLSTYSNISSTIIKHLKDEPKTIILYYYFSFRDSSTQTCENFLRSLLYQLLQSVEETPEALKNLFTSHNHGTQRPSLDEMISCLITVIKAQKDVRLLSDAFDECEEWSKLSIFITRIVQSCPVLRLLFTSRPYQNIQRTVNSLDIPMIDLTCKETHQDIEKFVSEALETDERFEHISAEGRCLVRETLTEKAHGMYVATPPYIMQLLI